MNGRDGYFGEDIAATYDSDATDMFSDDIVGPTVDVLAQLGRRWQRTAARWLRCRCPRH
jgi:hypothetical protein